MAKGEEIILNVTIILFVFCLGYCLKGYCCNDSERELEMITSMENEIDDLENRNSMLEDRNREQRQEITNLTGENLIVAVPSAPPIIAGISPVLAHRLNSPSSNYSEISS